MGNILPLERADVMPFGEGVAGVWLRSSRIMDEVRKSWWDARREAIEHGKLADQSSNTSMATEPRAERIRGALKKAAEEAAVKTSKRVVKPDSA